MVDCLVDSAGASKLHATLHSVDFDRHPSLLRRTEYEYEASALPSADTPLIVRSRDTDRRAYEPMKKYASM